MRVDNALFHKGATAGSPLCAAWQKMHTLVSVEARAVPGPVVERLCLLFSTLEITVACVLSMPVSSKMPKKLSQVSKVNCFVMLTVLSPSTAKLLLCR